MSKPVISTLDIANRQQREAANPNISTFVSASAGSGKTKLLTDRILRLLLAGTPARKILCLTYTKAAAAEMAIRLNLRLGDWVMMPDGPLGSQLNALGIIPAPETLANARQLFGEILELPGGIRISTIHAFCQSLLKRFPLEANLSPYFELEDEADSKNQLRSARELILGDVGKIDAIYALAAETNETEFTKTVQNYTQDGEVSAIFDNFSATAIKQLQAAALGVPDASEDELQQQAVVIRRQSELLKTLKQVEKSGTPSGQSWAIHCLDWLGQDNTKRVETFGTWWQLYFNKNGTRQDISRKTGKKLLVEYDCIVAEIDLERDRLEQIDEQKRALGLAKYNANMVDLIAPILQHHRINKVEQSLVSYADLIAKTLGLLRNQSQVAWILYKLDDGIDHLLLDEVQDTSPAQWQITNAITDEFFNGLGAREISRSVFAVGDQKQSIFSFQGADLDSFTAAKARFSSLVQNAGKNWLDGELSVSFRSTEPVLKLVDAIFAEGASCRGVCQPGALRHFVSRAGQAGKATLWPVTKSIDANPPPDWDAPENYVNVKSEKAVLADKIARYIQSALGQRVYLPSRDRPIKAGDFLILVRHRDELVHELTRACKARDIPIAGLDRLILTSQQAVSDLLALCDSLLLPSDDVSFAQFLVSPLGGLTDESLMDLAIDRRGSLSFALFARRAERSDWGEANEYFQALRKQVDFISPYALLSIALGPLGGRAKLMQRLGPEAGEPIDEMLAEAQSYVRSHPASLQQFVFDLRQSGATVKREPEGTGDVVRIMTVHGAKGLQAPIVILPDTTSIPKTSDHLFWLEVPEQARSIPIYCPHKDLRSQAISAAIADAKERKIEEYNRLLYVALTRAEDELVICGAEGKHAMPAESWYNAVKLGFAKLSVKPDESGSLQLCSAQSANPDRASHQEQYTHSELPGWVGTAPDWQSTPPNQETKRPEPLAPSRSTDGQETRKVTASPLFGLTPIHSGVNAMTRGKIIHTLLQHLPSLNPAERLEAAENYLSQPGLGLPDKMQSGIAATVLNLLGDEASSVLFGPGSRAEVPLAGVAGDIEIGGLVDRLVVTDQSVIIADFKTDRDPPATQADIPPAYLRQLAAYSVIVQQVFRGKTIICQLIWTESGACMEVPQSLLSGYAPAPAQAYADQPAT